MASTLKELIEDLQQAKQKLAIWEAVKEFIEQRSEEEGFWVAEDMTKVYRGNIDDVLEEIDSDMVAKLHAQIKKIENTEIGNGSGPRKKSRTSRKGAG